VTVISEEDYKNVGKQKLCESTKTLLGANQTVLKPSVKFGGRLLPGDAMLEEDIYNNNNNNNVYLINHPYQQEPFKGAVQVTCNIIIPQIICL